MALYTGCLSGKCWPSRFVYIKQEKLEQVSYNFPKIAIIIKFFVKTFGRINVRKTISRTRQKYINNIRTNDLLLNVATDPSQSLVSCIVIYFCRVRPTVSCALYFFNFTCSTCTNRLYQNFLGTLYIIYTQIYIAKIWKNILKRLKDVF